MKINYHFRVYTLQYINECIYMIINNINKILSVNRVNYCKPVYRQKCKQEFTENPNLYNCISVLNKNYCKRLQGFTGVYRGLQY